MNPNATIECDISQALKSVEQWSSDTSVRVVVQAAGAGARAAMIRHFRARNAEPASSAGFPRFGEQWPKRNFWSGVAKAVSEVSVQGDTATISVDSPALAHKADLTPPVITPKGGRRFLAIPANARSAGWIGMPKDFPVEMRFGYAPTPEGRWMPALLAKDNHLRRVSKGKNAGALVRAAGKSATTGVSTVQYWLVPKVQTKHDPRAIPSQTALSEAATKAAERTVRQLIRNQSI